MVRKQNSEQTEKQNVIQQRIVGENGQQIIKKYIRGKFLGKGGFARVFQITNLQTQKLSAAKIIPKSSLLRSRSKQKLITQIKIHRSLHYLNIVSFQHFFQDSQNVYILLQLCKNGTMSQLLKRRKHLTETEVQCYGLQLINAIHYLHTRKVIHRDLKLGNLFLSENMELKVGDFGLAVKLQSHHQRKRTVCGTPNYIAPQILDCKMGHSYQVDIWSFGVILYTLLVGKPPYQTSDVKTTYRRIRKNIYSFPQSVELSQCSKELISKILVRNPTKRASVQQILNHQFFSTGNIPKALPASLLHQAPQNILRYGPLPVLGQKRGQVLKLHSRKELKSLQDKRMKVGSKQRLIGEIIVQKWVDYTQKYGLAYSLNNGATGVYFNDSTKILMNLQETLIYYSQKNDSSVSQYSIKNYPDSLQKKVVLVTHFKNYLKNQKFNFGFYFPQVYVEKWVQTQHAMIFKFSNQTVQVDFQDRSQVILSQGEEAIYYVNKFGDLILVQRSKENEIKNEELKKRIKYIKEILKRTSQAGNSQYK